MENNRFRSNLTGDLPARSSAFNAKIIIPVVAVIVLLVAGFWVYKGKSTTTSSETETSEAAGASTNEEILAKLGKIYMVPEGEVPQVRTAGEVMQNLQDKSILAGAVETDKLVIYNTAGKVVIFRPSTGQIVNILPLNAPAQSSGTSASTSTGSATPEVAGATDTSNTTTATPDSTASSNDTTPLATLTGEVRNGTTQAGAAGTLAKKIQADLGVKSVKTGNAANTDYTKTVLVNVSGKNISAIEKSLGVTSVNALPDGEKASTADFLVIYGK